MAVPLRGQNGGTPNCKLMKSKKNSFFEIAYWSIEWFANLWVLRPPPTGWRRVSFKISLIVKQSYFSALKSCDKLVQGVSILSCRLVAHVLFSYIYENAMDEHPFIFRQHAASIYGFVRYVRRKKMQATSKQGRRLRFGMFIVLTNIRSTKVLHHESCILHCR